MMYWIGVLCAIFILFFVLCVCDKKIKPVLHMTEAILLFSVLYMIISGLLFLFNIFNILLCTVIVLMISFGLGLYFYDKEKLKRIKKLEIEESFRESWVSYLVIIFIGIFTFGWFGYFGMYQDQGVYQVEAVTLLYGDTENFHNIDEYSALPESEYKNKYLDSIGTYKGFYTVAGNVERNMPGISMKADMDESTGFFHGLPTFPSMLALSACLFGLENLPMIQTIFYICFLLVIEFLLKNMKVPFWLRGIMLCLLGLSPIIVWVKKSTLTEMFLTLLMASYIYLLLNPDQKRNYWSVIPLLGFCFFHVSVFTMMPVFLLIYWYLYYTTNQKQFLVCAKILIIGYCVGFYMMYKTRPNYTFDNYAYGMPFIPISFIPVVVVLACVLAWIITIIISNKRDKIKIDHKKIVQISAR